MPSRRRDAAILLIGSELLSGRVADENLVYLASSLWELGVRVRETRIVPDEIESIASGVRVLSGSHDWLLTTGGIGPTHDDVTIDGVALAFGVDVEIHPELERSIRDRLGDAVTAAHLRMARVPRGAVLAAHSPGIWPTVQIENTFVLPGVPSILRRKFSRLRPLFEQGCFHRELLEVEADEALLAPLLGLLDANHPEVQIGSYPVGAGRVVVSVEGEDRRAVEIALAELRERLSLF